MSPSPRPTTALRAMRIEAGVTQSELAAAAGVSRQMVGAVESGRHLPRVDAATALAAALDTDVETLFPTNAAPLTISGNPPSDGDMVRVGRVGSQLVTAPARIGSDGWDVADGVVQDGGLVQFGSRAPGFVVAGCEPALDLLEHRLRERGMGALSVSASSTRALAALDAGLIHAAVVHGPASDRFPDQEPSAIEAYVVARWRVGLGSAQESPPGWWDKALSGGTAVVQREAGAGVQQAFERAAGAEPGSIEGPRVATHLEAARAAALTEMPAVTIEPAALAVGVLFHPLEVHEAQLWIAARWGNEHFVSAALETLTESRFQQRLAAVGGYDLSRTATRIPAS